MYDNEGFFEDELSTVVEKDGETLRIVVIKISEQEWELSIQNKYKINSTWFEFFPTAQSAIDEGLKTIEEEGVASFLDIEGFEYLFSGSHK